MTTELPLAQVAAARLFALLRLGPRRLDRLEAWTERQGISAELRRAAIAYLRAENLLVLSGPLENELAELTEGAAFPGLEQALAAELPLLARPAPRLKVPAPASPPVPAVRPDAAPRPPARWRAPLVAFLRQPRTLDEIRAFGAGRGWSPGYVRNLLSQLVLEGQAQRLGRKNQRWYRCTEEGEDALELAEGSGS